LSSSPNIMLILFSFFPFNLMFGCCYSAIMPLKAATSNEKAVLPKQGSEHSLLHFSTVGVSNGNLHFALCFSAFPRLFDDPFIIHFDTDLNSRYRRYFNKRYDSFYIKNDAAICNTHINPYMRCSIKMNPNIGCSYANSQKNI
jgi:hypothetical protein